MSLLCYKSFSQSVLLQSFNASGNSVKNDDNQFISYSVGQPFYLSKTNNSHTLNEGLQQALLNAIYDDSNEDIDTDVVDANIDILLSPNPTPDIALLATKGLDLNQKNSYEIYDYNGKLLKQEAIKDKNTVINLTTLSSSIYILQVFVKEKLWKTIKIIKK